MATIPDGFVVHLTMMKGKLTTSDSIDHTQLQVLQHTRPYQIMFVDGVSSGVNWTDVC